MIRICTLKVTGFEEAIRAMRNPMNSWASSDSGYDRFDDYISGNNSWGRYNIEKEFVVGEKDLTLMKKLAAAGPSHSKYRRMIIAYMDISAPLYWWKEFDTYKVGTVAGSTSTMHKIHVKKFELDDFSWDKMISDESDEDIVKSFMSYGHFYLIPSETISLVIDTLNDCRDLYLKTKDKRYWYSMIQLLPSSYNQLRTVMLNYEVLANIYETRKDHKLDEWRKFCEEIEKLPYSEIITGEIK